MNASPKTTCPDASWFNVKYGWMDVFPVSPYPRSDFQIGNERDIFDKLLLGNTPCQRSRREKAPFLPGAIPGRTVGTETGRCQYFAVKSVIDARQIRKQ